jgi:hypothetical protein
MVGDAACQLDHGSNAAAGPERSPDAIGFGTAVPQPRQLGHRCGGEPARSAGRWTGSERLRSPLPGTRHPLTDGPLADAQGLGNLVLGPAPLLEVPGLQASGFFPVVWCRVHASQSITEPRELELLMPGSVRLAVS